VDELFDTQLDPFFHQRIYEGNQRLGAFNGEALATDVAGLEVLFEGLRHHKAREDVTAQRGRERRSIQHGLDLLLQPSALLLLGDIQVLDAQRTTVSQAQLFDEITEGAIGRPKESPLANRAVEIGSRAVILRYVKQRMMSPVLSKEVKIGNDMP
jgi:hypothetical protein